MCDTALGQRCRCSPDGCLMLGEQPSFASSLSTLQHFRPSSYPAIAIWDLAENVAEELEEVATALRHQRP
jgi:hypothetical protein